jgi:hypothetical protein
VNSFESVSRKQKMKIEITAAVLCLTVAAFFVVLDRADCRYRRNLAAAYEAYAVNVDSFCCSVVPPPPRRRLGRGVAGHKLVGHAQQVPQHIVIDTG